MKVGVFGVRGDSTLFDSSHRGCGLDEFDKPMRLYHSIGGCICTLLRVLIDSVKTPRLNWLRLQRMLLGELGKPG